MAFLKITDKLTLRFFERVETDHSDRLVQETGMVIGDRLHTVITGVGSPLVTEEGRKSASKAAVKAAKTAAVVAPAAAVTVVATPTVAAPMAAVAIATAVIHTALDNQADGDDQAVAA